MSKEIKFSDLMEFSLKALEDIIKWSSDAKRLEAIKAAIMLANVNNSQVKSDYVKK